MSARNTAARLRQRGLDETLRLIMSQPNGRQFVWELLSRTKVFQSCFSTRALEMAFHEGERNIGLALLADLMRVCPGQYTTMAQENGESDERSTNGNSGSTAADTLGDEDGDAPGDGPAGG